MPIVKEPAAIKSLKKAHDQNSGVKVKRTGLVKSRLAYLAFFPLVHALAGALVLVKVSLVATAVAPPLAAVAMSSV